MSTSKIKEPKVAIIIITHNPNFKKNTLLEDLLKSLKEKTKYKNYITYITDNASHPKINQRVEENFSWVRLIKNKTNLGFCLANNVAIKKTMKEDDPDYILLLNDDMLVNDPNWLSAMIEEGGRNRRAGIIGCRNIYPDGSEQWYAKDGNIKFHKHPGTFDKSKNKFETQIVQQVVGCIFLVKKGVIKKIGFFDPKFAPFYGEETDYCLHAKKAGYDSLYVGRGEIIHYRDQCISTFKPNYIWYIQLRHSIRLELLNFSLSKILGMFFVHLASTFINTKGEKNKLRKDFLMKIGLFVKAYLFNIYNLKEILEKRRIRNNY